MQDGDGGCSCGAGHPASPLRKQRQEHWQFRKERLVLFRQGRCLRTTAKRLRHFVEQKNTVFLRHCAHTRFPVCNVRTVF